MKIIVPCCGRSSRFPGQPPKWTLPAHDGRPMICRSIEGLDMSLDDLVVTILREHEERFQVAAGLAEAFGQPIKLAILDQATRSQSETVARTLEVVGFDEPFLVKDSDGYFGLDALEAEDNYVCVDTLNNVDSINPRSKSYVQVDEAGIVTNIREKVVISDLFNVGGYYFTSPPAFLEFYRRLSGKASSTSEIYISNVIDAMIGEGIRFRARQTSGYEDWGTVKEWRRALLARKAFFVLLDGFVFERGSRYFSPRFADVKPQPRAVEAVKSLAGEGHEIIYLSIRPQSHEALTLNQIERAGLPAGPILWSCPSAQWVMVTAPHPTLPLLTSQAMEVPADDSNLLETMGGNLGLL